MVRRNRFMAVARHLKAGGIGCIVERMRHQGIGKPSAFIAARSFRMTGSSMAITLSARAPVSTKRFSCAGVEALQPHFAQRETFHRVGRLQVAIEGQQHHGVDRGRRNAGQPPNAAKADEAKADVLVDHNDGPAIDDGDLIDWFGSLSSQERAIEPLSMASLLVSPAA